MSLDEVGNDVLVVCNGLLRADPATHGDLESTALDEGLNSLLELGCLSSVPHVEVFHLYIGELHVRVSLQFVDNF